MRAFTWLSFLYTNFKHGHESMTSDEFTCYSASIHCIFGIIGNLRVGGAGVYATTHFLGFGFVDPVRCFRGVLHFLYLDI
jgi:hypothetical protein